MNFKRLRADEVQSGTAIEYDISRGITAIGEVSLTERTRAAGDTFVMFTILDPVRPDTPVIKLIRTDTILNTWTNDI